MKTIAMNGLILSLVMLICVGCVSQSEVDRLHTKNRVNLEQIEELKFRIEEMQLTTDQLRTNGEASVGELASARQEVEQGHAQVAQLQASLKAAQSRLAAANAQIAALHGAGPMPLPKKINDALATLAHNNPQLMSYDQKLGMIKMTSDLTFTSGSDKVADRAVTGLAELGSIFRSPEAAEYEVRIVGHTDNTSIVKPETKAKHPTNWHLSVHRAIAVKDMLHQSGVAENRMSVAGYGKEQPIAPATAQGNHVNRRVEIYLVPDSFQVAVDTIVKQPTTSSQSSRESSATATPESEVFK